MHTVLLRAFLARPQAFDGQNADSVVAAALWAEWARSMKVRSVEQERTVRMKYEIASILVANAPDRVVLAHLGMYGEQANLA